jgi:uncharacterized protein
MAGLEVRRVGECVLFKVKVVPASSKTAFAGQLQGMLKVRVQAPPEKGKANDCLLAFLAARLGVRKNAVKIVAGRSSPVKEVAVHGLAIGAVTEMLERA